MTARKSDIYVGEEKHRHRRPRANQGRSTSTNAPSLSVYPTYRSRGAVFATSGYEYKKRRRRLIAMVVVAVVIAIAAAAYFLWPRPATPDVSTTRPNAERYLVCDGL